MPDDKAARAEAGVPLLSVLVPIYNWDLRPLLGRLAAEIESAGLAPRVEILLADDASSDRGLQALNRAALAALGSRFHYEERPENLGRAALRNHLVESARGDYLLFLDADVLPDSPHFLRRYLDYLESGSWDVICGGISYRTRVLEGRDYDFYRYLSGRSDVKPAALRNQAPGRHVLSSNLLLRKDLIWALPFDTRFRGYGYEDVEWGLRAEKTAAILHIDNPVSHLGLVGKAQAYERMRLSMENYRLLLSCHPDFFRHSEIRPFVLVFGRLHRHVLRALDAALRRLYFHAPPPLAFYAFQLSKAVLLAQTMPDRRSERGR